TCVPASPSRRSTWRSVWLSRSWANISARSRLSSKFFEPMTMRSAAWRGRAKNSTMIHASPDRTDPTDRTDPSDVQGASHPPHLQQSLHIRVRRLRRQLLRAAELEEAAGAHDADAVGEAEGFGEVVGHQDGRLPQSLLEIEELAVELQAGQGV